MPPRTPRHTTDDALDMGGDGPPSSDMFLLLFSRLDADGQDRIINYMHTLSAGLTA